MSSIFSDGQLHPGRDANDSAWLVLRRPEDWAGATLTGVVIDPAIPGLILTPAGLAGTPDPAEIADDDGTRYRSDPDGDQVLRRGPCDLGWTRFVGARGTETGKLRRPLGLALDRRRGLLAIADADNHRVQIVRTGGATGDPMMILGSADPTSPRALVEPVAVAFGSHRLAIADRAGGKIHLYDDRFAWLAAFAPIPAHVTSGFVPAPVAVAVAGCAVWVIDAAWSVPIAYDLKGHVIADAGAVPDDLATWLAHATSVPRGEVVHGPIDGRSEDLAWHRVLVDAVIPEGAAIEVQTYASDDPIMPAVIPWAPAKPTRLPVSGVEPPDGVNARPVLSDQGRWMRQRGEPYLRSARSIGRLTSGPINVSGFAVVWQIARRLRIGDSVELRTAGGVTVMRPIAGISDRSIRAVTRGDLQLYGAGSRLTLIERAGEPPLGGPRLIATLAAGSSLDLASAVADETLYDLPATHAVAALVRDGDILHIDDGILAEATIVVNGVDPADAVIVLAAAVVGDFSTSDLRIVTANDRLVVDRLDWVDDAPAGETIFIHDDAAGTIVAATLRWAERDTRTLWLDPGPPIPWLTWNRFTLPDPVATDRGRYLWLRLRLLGAVAHAGDAIAMAGPVIRSIRLLLPRLSLLRYLPAVYSRRDADDPTGALFLERLLALPEARLTDIEAMYEDVARQLNPLASSSEWLTFIAAWYGLAFDPSWPIERRRQLVVHAHELFARRGTVEGIRRYLEIYLGTTPTIVEGFQWRVARPPLLGSDGVLGTIALGGDVGGDVGLAHHFSIWVSGDGAGCGNELVAKAARAILESIKPAHTTYDLHVVDGNPRVGISSSLGIDMVLLGGTVYPPLGLPPGTSSPPVLGQLTLPASRTPAPTLAPIPLDTDFKLT